ncbi:MAG: hypothetical protein OHK0013_18460 [Sandaracinaceae bacterium]
MIQREPAIVARLGSIQLALHQDRARGWLLYDHRGRSVVAARLLASHGLRSPRSLAAPAPASARIVTEHRFFFWIPAEGLPVAIAHEDDLGALPELPGDVVVYGTPLELRNALEKHLPRAGIVLLEQGPFAQIADLALVDEATLSLLRAREVSVRSSIELANRFAGPLTADERAELGVTVAALNAMLDALSARLSAAAPSSWDEVWDVVEDLAGDAGLVLDPEAGLAIEGEARGRRALARGGGALATSAAARLDLWASRREGGRSVVVPASMGLCCGSVSAGRAELEEALEACEGELLATLEARARRGRLLGSEVAELAHDATRQRGIELASRCVGWPLGPVPRGSHACTFDAEGFADPRELVPETVWGLCLAGRRGEVEVRRTCLVERTDRGLAILARGRRASVLPI